MKSARSTQMRLTACSKALGISAAEATKALQQFGRAVRPVNLTPYCLEDWYNVYGVKQPNAIVSYAATLHRNDRLPRGTSKHVAKSRRNLSKIIREEMRTI